MTVVVEVKCPAHPRYRALKRPTADCSVCRQIYWMVNGSWKRYEVKHLTLPDDCPHCGGSAPA